MPTSQVTTGACNVVNTTNFEAGATMPIQGCNGTVDPVDLEVRPDAVVRVTSRSGNYWHYLKSKPTHANSLQLDTRGGKNLG
jgi:hypothetical protein